MGNVLAVLGVVTPLLLTFIMEAAVLRQTVFSALTRCLEVGVEGVAGGMVAAVQVSVTGQSSDFIFIPCPLEYILPPFL